jgi:hypothetical protein
MFRRDSNSELDNILRTQNPERGGTKFMMVELQSEKSIVGLYKAEIEPFPCGIRFLNSISERSVPCHYLPHCSPRNASSEIVDPKELYAKT